MRLSIASFLKSHPVVVHVGALLLSIAMLARYAEGRGPYFARPLTVMDHVGPGEHETRAVLLLVPQVEPHLPSGAEVSCFRPKNGQAWNDDATYLTTVGLLPRQNVIPPWTAAVRGNEVTEYVIAVGSPFDHPWYTLVARFPNGWLYKRR